MIDVHVLHGNWLLSTCLVPEYLTIRNENKTILPHYQLPEPDSLVAKHLRA